MRHYGETGKFTYLLTNLDTCLDRLAYRLQLVVAPDWVTLLRKWDGYAPIALTTAKLLQLPSTTKIRVPNCLHFGSQKIDRNAR